VTLLAVEDRSSFSPANQLLASLNARVTLSSASENLRLLLCEPRERLGAVAKVTRGSHHIATEAWADTIPRYIRLPQQTNRSTHPNAVANHAITAERTFRPCDADAGSRRPRPEVARRARHDSKAYVQRAYC